MIRHGVQSAEKCRCGDVLFYLFFSEAIHLCCVWIYGISLSEHISRLQHCHNDGFQHFWFVTTKTIFMMFKVLQKQLSLLLNYYAQLPRQWAAYEGLRWWWEFIYSDLQLSATNNCFTQRRPDATQKSLPSPRMPIAALKSLWGCALPTGESPGLTVLGCSGCTVCCRQALGSHRETESLVLRACFGRRHLWRTVLKEIATARAVLRTNVLQETDGGMYTTVLQNFISHVWIARCFTGPSALYWTTPL